MGFPFTIEDEAKLLPLKNARLTDRRRMEQMRRTHKCRI